MKHLIINKTKYLSAAALTAMLLVGVPASATESRGDMSIHVSYGDGYRAKSAYRGGQYSARPIKIYLNFVGADRRYEDREFRRFKRSVANQMQARSDRRIIFVRNPRAADRVVRISKRQWRNDYRAYTRGGYYPERRYIRYDERNDPTVQVAFAALRIAQIIQHEKRLDRRAERRAERREERRRDRWDDRRSDRREDRRDGRR